MKKFKVTFIHTDGDTRNITIEAYNKERAILRFYVNWGNEMDVLNISKL